MKHTHVINIIFSLAVSVALVIGYANIGSMENTIASLSSYITMDSMDSSFHLNDTSKSIRLFGIK
jgi:Tfp pilus assembly protein PilO